MTGVAEHRNTRGMDTRDTLAKLRRDSARNVLNMRKILDHFGIPHATEEDVDRAIAEQDRTAPRPRTAPADRPQP